MPDTGLDGIVDVAIVGAGIIGLASAAYLQDAGLRVVLIDRKGIAQEASAQNAGAFAYSDILPLASPRILRQAPKWLLDPLGPLSIPPAYLPRILPWLLRFWRASWPDRVRDSIIAQTALMRLARAETPVLQNMTGTGHMLRTGGALHLYESERELRDGEPGWNVRAAQNIAFKHLLGREAIAEYQPGLSNRFVAATFVPEWHTISDPSDYAQAIGRHVLANGAGLVERAVETVGESGELVRVGLSDGTSLTARYLLVAAGAWSHHLARQLGDRIPLETERGYNTTLPTSSFDLRRQLILGGHGFVITPLSSGIRIGGAVELGGLLRQPNFARAEIMLRKAKQFLPDLVTEGGRQWMGFRPSLPDSLPVIARAPRHRSIIYAFGHGHLGLTQSAATGRLVCDIITGNAPATDLAPFRAERF